QGLRPGQRVAARLSGIEATAYAAEEAEIRVLLRLDEPDEGFAATAALPVGGVRVELDTAGAIDVAAERQRLDKDLASARKEKDQAERKLGNEQFLAKAPAEVVAKIRDRLTTAEADITRIEGQLANLPAPTGLPEGAR